MCDCVDTARKNLAGVDGKAKAKGVVINADDLLLLFVYVIMQSGVLHLHAHLQFMHAFLTDEQRGKCCVLVCGVWHVVSWVMRLDCISSLSCVSFVHLYNVCTTWFQIHAHTPAPHTLTTATMTGYYVATAMAAAELILTHDLSKDFSEAGPETDKE